MPGYILNNSDDETVVPYKSEYVAKYMADAIATETGVWSDEAGHIFIRYNLNTFLPREKRWTIKKIWVLIHFLMFFCIPITSLNSAFRFLVPGALFITWGILFFLYLRLEYGWRVIELTPDVFRLWGPRVYVHEEIPWAKFEELNLDLQGGGMYGISITAKYTNKVISKGQLELIPGIPHTMTPKKWVLSLKYLLEKNGMSHVVEKICWCGSQLKDLE